MNARPSDIFYPDRRTIARAVDNPRNCPFSVIISVSASECRHLAQDGVWLPDSRIRDELHLRLQRRPRRRQPSGRSILPGFSPAHRLRAHHMRAASAVQRLPRSGKRAGVAPFYRRGPPRLSLAAGVVESSSVPAEPLAVPMPRQRASRQHRHVSTCPRRPSSLPTPDDIAPVSACLPQMLFAGHSMLRNAVPIAHRRLPGPNHAPAATAAAPVQTPHFQNQAMK